MSIVAIGDLAAAIRNRTDLIFGLYHSMYEWFHPLFKEDKKNLFLTNHFPTVRSLLIERQKYIKQ